MKDWRLWVFLIGIYLMVKMCGGCKGCDGIPKGMVECQQCGRIEEQAYEGSTICRWCNENNTDKFNKYWEKREKAIPVRPYQVQIIRIGHNY